MNWIYAIGWIILARHGLLFYIERDVVKTYYGLCICIALAPFVAMFSVFQKLSEMDLY